MQGYKVLWVPGCDHAGIATQVCDCHYLFGSERENYKVCGYVRACIQYECKHVLICVCVCVCVSL